MPLRVIGVGLGRTGTDVAESGAEMLGLKPC